MSKLSDAQILEQPGVARLCDITIDYIRSFDAACQALEKIATSRNAQTMRNIARQTLATVRYGQHAHR